MPIGTQQGTSNGATERPASFTADGTVSMQETLPNKVRPSWQVPKRQDLRRMALAPKGAPVPKGTNRDKASPGGPEFQPRLASQLVGVFLVSMATTVPLPPLLEVKHPFPPSRELP